ncbi:DUF3106 domain-containing protein [uncultured Sphaerotilus sp.]|uniref:DUF3106 domain-containing protein n=1 Tax=uncultured Sphaerotilus sp. TaxID=474984 RepID=UPI0030CA4D2E
MVFQSVRARSVSGLMLATLALAFSMQVGAQGQPVGASGPTWAELSAGERQALQPLQSQWNGIDSLRKQKWRDVANRYASLPAVQQDRLHERMVEWATMSPAQRNAARINFEELRKLPATERQTRWEAYQSLPADARQALLTQAGSRPLAASAVQSPAAARKSLASGDTQSKSNIVATPQTVKPLSVAPGTVQAGVGASTRPINKPPTPPRHQQSGMPKIAATPEFVQNDTLLPQRGPQGAGATPAARPDVP